MGYHVELLLLFMTRFTLLETCISTNLNFLSPFNDKVVSEYLLWNKDVNNRLDCVSDCHHDSRCHSLQFRESDKICRGFASAFTSPEKLVSSTSTGVGYRLFPMPTAVSFIGSTCESDHDCSVANSVCNDGICSCGIMFLYDPKTGTCVTGCSSWGDELTRYSGTGIGHIDDNTFTGITEAECIQRCVDAKNDTFTCLTAEYYPAESKCHTNKIIYASAPATSYMTDSPWITYARNCAV